MRFVLLHLTDIHMRSKKDDNFIFYKADRLCSAIQSVIENDDLVIIAFTGDAAYHGFCSEYSNCLDLFLLISEAIRSKSGNDPIWKIVPGNHDCNTSISRVERAEIISNTVKSDVHISPDSLHKLCSCQDEFNTFASLFSESEVPNGANAFDEVSTPLGTVVFIKYNSAIAYMNKEKDGCDESQLFINTDQLHNKDMCTYKLAVSMIHHPTTWFHPDHSVVVDRYLTTMSDVILIGHEHKKNDTTIMGESWSTTLLRGKELQSDNCSESGFSLLIWTDEFSKITEHSFIWNDTEGIYEHIAAPCTKQFQRNIHTIGNTLVFNSEFISQLEDPGQTIHHLVKEKVKLSDIYCWPDYEELDNKKRKLAFVPKYGSKEALKDHIYNENLTVICGESMVGKSALANMLALAFSNSDYVPVLCEGSDFKSSVAVQIQETIEKSFVCEYSQMLLERFRQCESKRRVLIIDGFDYIGQIDKRRRIIDQARKQFVNIVLFTTDSDISLYPVELYADECTTYSTLRLLMMGNRKRAELIEKWYDLCDDALSDEEKRERTQKAIYAIDMRLGNTQAILPPLPIYIINMIQILDCGESISVGLTQSGYIYEDIIKRSIGSAKMASGEMSILQEILSHVAYYMLREQKHIVSRDELIKIINTYNDDYMHSVEFSALVRQMMQCNIFKQRDDDRYAFKYPYILYYYAAKYISCRLDADEMNELIANMINKMHIDAYSNILVFICHFVHDERIIRGVLEKGLTLFSDLKEFDYSSYNGFLCRASSVLSKLFDSMKISRDEEVEENKSRQLKARDDVGILDGTIHDDESLNRIKEQKEMEGFGNLGSVIKTIDVLGQILRNYAGALKGDAKTAIIRSGCSLAMRLVSFFTTVFEDGEVTLIEQVAELVSKENPKFSFDEAKDVSMKILSDIFMMMNYTAINIVSRSIGQDNLRTAINSILAKGSISDRLIWFDVSMNSLRLETVDEAIDFYNELIKSGNKYASYMLKLIVFRYLQFNHMSVSKRDKLCSKFNFDVRSIITARASLAANTPA